MKPDEVLGGKSPSLKPIKFSLYGDKFLGFNWHPPMRVKKSVSLLLTMFFVAFILILLPSQESLAKKSNLNKYRKCRMKCLNKDEKCNKKAEKKFKHIVKEEIKCMTKKNKCLEKCSDYI